MGPADDIRAEAARLGFDAVRFTAARLPEAAGDALDGFLSQGYAGDMDWLTATRARRRSPERMWPDAATAIVLGVNYGPAGDPLAILRQRDRGGISVYAQNDDYHDVVKKRLKALARWIAGRFDAGVKVFVDTAPLMEKPLAEQAGLGWQGKHTNLVSREFGSWLFLGAILTTLDLPADAPEVDHCGSCRACLDICPTGAFPAPGRIDARRCISYLTIEHKGPIPRDLRPLIGNRIYGCDDCLAVCPWNKYARLTEEPAFLPRAELAAPRLADLADARRCRLPGRVPQVGGQADRPRPLRPQRIDRDRQQREPGVGRIRRKAVAGCVGAGPGRGGVGAAAARSGASRGAPAPRRGGGDGPGSPYRMGGVNSSAYPPCMEPLRRGVPRYGAQARLLGMRGFF